MVMLKVGENIISEKDFFNIKFNQMPIISVVTNYRLESNVIIEKEYIDTPIINEEGIEIGTEKKWVDVEKNIMIPVYDSEDIEATKVLFKKIFNIKADKELSELDWKVLRHKEQLELNIETSLNATEYQTLLESKQAIRDKVNNLEQQINACLTIDEINQLNW